MEIRKNQVQGACSVMEKERRKQNILVGKLMKGFVDQTVEFYNGMKERKICRPTDKKVWDRLCRQTVPVKGRPLEEVYQEMLDDVYMSISLAQHPRSFSCVPSTASLVSWMGDIMTNAFNPHASCKRNALAADLIEKKMIHWMCDLAGYPQGCGGLFVSGGSMANLTALTAARDSRLKEEERGKAVVYLSDQTHISLAKGLHIIGFFQDQIRMIPTDRDFRMDISLLKEAVKEDAGKGKIPFAVIATAGTTNTGSVDPLPEIAALCKEYHMWMHVDGAFGASALLSEKQRKYLAGIELSDSLSWDAHKWMMQTYGCSVVLVRDQNNLTRSFAAHPEYLKDAKGSKDSVEFWDLGPELTRPARALKLWITLQTFGSQEMGTMIDHGCEMAEFTEKVIGSDPDWEIVSPARLGIVNFRYAPAGVSSESELARINQIMARQMTESGYAQVFTTEIHGKRVLRMCTIHPETTKEDILLTISRLKSLKPSDILKDNSCHKRTA